IIINRKSLIFANPLVDDMTPNDTPIPPRQRWLKVTLLSVLALVVFGFASRNLIFGKPVKTYEAVRSSLVQTIVASGNIITPGRESVGADIVGHAVGDGSFAWHRSQATARGIHGANRVIRFREDHAA